MVISKIISLKNNITVRQFYNLGVYSFIFYSEGSKLAWKIRLSTHAFYTGNSLLVLSNKLSYNDYYKSINFVAKSLYDALYFNYSFFGKLHMIGLGFKNFILGEKLYILVGDCNYIIFDIPRVLKVYCKKNQIYLLSTDSIILYDFIATLKKVKKSNFYKGKGVLEFKNFKFTKLRVGKKQRFM